MSFDPSAFDPSTLSQETREDIMREYISSLRKVYGKKDPFTIWHREMEYCDSLLKKMEKCKAQDDSYIRSRVVLYEIERMMAESNIPLPKRKRTLASILSTSPVASISPTGENSGSVLAWLDSFDPATLTLEERMEISGGMVEDVEQQYAHHRELLRKALARNLSTETCRRNLSHALLFKIQLSLVQLRAAFNPVIFSERVRSIRIGAGDTVETFAMKVGKRVEEVTLWESGAIGKRNAITNDDLVKICNFYVVRVEELIEA